MILNTEQSQNIVTQLRDELNPIRIYLFGSQANGTASEDGSDIDLCIVVPDDSEHVFKKATRAYRALRNFKFPKDILVRHKTRFEERSTWVNSLEREIAERGTVLYTQ